MNKVKKPFYQRWWFIVICVFFGLALLGGLTGESEKKIETENNAQESKSKKSKKSKESKPEPLVVTVDELYEALDSNALKASSTYKNKYVQVAGTLANIDSDGKYFTLEGDNTILFESLHVSIPKSKKDSILNNLMEYSIGDTLTVTGEITVVGEIMGYTMNIDTLD